MNQHPCGRVAGVLWGLMLVPYRFLRRGQRKQRLAQVRHQELMNRVWAASPAALCTLPAGRDDHRWVIGRVSM